MEGSDPQSNGTEQSPEIDAHKYGLLVFGRGTKAIQWKKDSLFNKQC